MLTNYNTSGSYVRSQQKVPGQQLVAASKMMLKVGSSHSVEPAVKFNSQPIAKVQIQPCMNAYAQPIMNVKAQSIMRVEAQPTAKVKASPVTNMATHKYPHCADWAKG
jgi:hypothetical protein